ncbi:type III polyketide synthase [Marinigracilibium pacificum]|uniref:Type III polyketide synthase n=1 Tax=Marinigracilibium pacificum TaxID=2729599 RepID=A0A848J3Y2_9BACT|nr:type III polyketide synthase [Marinigracilibium pacificum]NMM50431.1 type III polyketide synthase [Marinigracilibium pacificum]
MYITGIELLNAPYRIEQSHLQEMLGKALNLDESSQRAFNVLYRATGINTRNSVVQDYIEGRSIDFFADEGDRIIFPSTRKRMEMYRSAIISWLIPGIKKVFNEKYSDKKFTHLITVSCTGMYAPGLDYDIQYHLGLDSSIFRQSINFMGCYAGISALRMAADICKGLPNARVLIVDVEMCSLHFQNSTTHDDLLSNSLFADGAALITVEGQKPESNNAVKILGFETQTIPDSMDDMAWEIGNEGFNMKLSTYVPKLLGNQLEKFSEVFDHYDDMIFAIHPGGKRILEAFESAFKIEKEKLKFSYEVLRNNGNMSSVTIFYVLKRIIEQGVKGQAFAAAFGPGLTMEAAKLEIS